MSEEDELEAREIYDVLVFRVNAGAVVTAWARDQGVEARHLYQE